MPPTSSDLIRLTFGSRWGLKIFKIASLGASYVRYRTRYILAILNLYVAQMPPIKFGFTLHYCWGDVIWRNSRCPVAPILAVRWNKFRSSESPCLPNASHQVSAYSDLLLESRCRFKIFNWSPWWPFWILEQKLAILNLYITPMPPNKFWLNLTYQMDQMRFEDFQDGQFGGHLSQILDQNHFSNSESLCCSYASHQVSV